MFENFGYKIKKAYIVAAKKQNVIWKCTIYITLLKKKLVVWIILWKWVNISVTKEKKKITEKPVVIIRFTWQNASQWKLHYYLPKGSQCRGSGTLDPCHSQHPPTILKDVLFLYAGLSAYINVLFPHSMNPFLTPSHPHSLHSSVTPAAWSASASGGLLEYVPSLFLKRLILSYKNTT